MCIVTLGSHMSFSTAASRGLFPVASGFTVSISLAKMVHNALSAEINWDNVTRLKFVGGSEAYTANMDVSHFCEIGQDKSSHISRATPLRCQHHCSLISEL